MLVHQIIEPSKLQDTNYSKNGLTNYLVHISKIPLLSSENQLQYARQVQQMMSLLDLKAELTTKNQIEPTEVFWAKAAQITVSQLQNLIIQGQNAKHKLIEANLRLVVSVAKKYQNYNLELTDLIQEGTLGLQRGIEKFDPNKGYKFSTYTYYWIRQAITQAIDNKSRTIRLPVHVCNKIRNIKKVQRELIQKLGKKPALEDVAANVSLKTTDVQRYLQIARKPISLDIKVGEAQDNSLQDFLENTHHQVETSDIEGSLEKKIQELLYELTPSERDVIILVFGLQGGQELSLHQVASQLNISDRKVNRLKKKAIKKLRGCKQKFAEI